MKVEGGQVCRTVGKAIGKMLHVAWEWLVHIQHSVCSLQHFQRLSAVFLIHSPFKSMLIYPNFYFLF